MREGNNEKFSIGTVSFKTGASQIKVTLVLRLVLQKSLGWHYVTRRHYTCTVEHDQTSFSFGPSVLARTGKGTCAYTSRKHSLLILLLEGIIAAVKL